MLTREEVHALLQQEEVIEKIKSGVPFFEIEIPAGHPEALRSAAREPQQ
jgi:hypothetical protein